MINIAPHPMKPRMVSAEDIRRAAENGLEMRFRDDAEMYCRLAVTVSGWCTVVLRNGSIAHGWAGEFVLKARCNKFDKSVVFYLYKHTNL